MTTQGMGMQQHSYPSHSKHLVLPGALPWPVASAGLIMLSMVETAALPGPLGILTDFLTAWYGGGVGICWLVSCQLVMESY